VGTNEGLIDALDTLDDGDTAAAAEAFGHAWLGTYGIDVDAEVIDGATRLIRPFTKVG